MRLLTILTLATTALAQPSFEVASVKEVVDFVPGTMSENIVANPGNLTMRNVRLRACLKWAYDVRDYQIAGPSWMGAPGWGGREIARYEILAKAPADTSILQMKLMLQRALAERFKLVLHRETKEMPVLILSVAKPSTELRRSADPGSQGHIGPGPEGSLKFVNSTMAEFAELLSGPLRIPIVDRTGLDDRFDFVLRNPPGARDNVFVLEDLPEAIRAQLGLKLEKQKAPIDMLIIDSAEKRPVAN